jgi:hypothetical protein
MIPSEDVHLAGASRLQVVSGVTPFEKGERGPA